MCATRLAHYTFFYLVPLIITRVYESKILFANTRLWKNLVTWKRMYTHWDVKDF